MLSEDTFDPMISPVEASIIPHLLDIAHRARRYLNKRASIEVRSAQETIEEWVSIFFETLYEDEVSALRRRAEDGDQRAIGYFHVERHFYGDDWDEYRLEINEFNDRYRDDLDIPDETNTTEVRALDSCIDWFDLSETAFGDQSESLYFAALALKYVEKSIWYINRWMEPEGESAAAEKMMVELYEATRKFVEVKEGSTGKFCRPINTDFRFACEAAIDAMEAITCASKYDEVNKVRRDLAEKVDQVLSAASKELQEKHIAEQMQAKKKRSADLNAKRHKKNREAQALVLAEWERDTSRFSSAEKAGQYFETWLSDIPGKGFTFSQRTVRDWIRARATEIGVVWR
ncbi:hypothetical protein [Pararobbsia silviterrae]|uniref:Uncharacterized protein n=1 Tax=Pararobbsia silviterrae TaxID=1792498 RepID=A0A494Y7F3_9BURK|nr:hypothetical protein [Pararobbsia silviterrae]RKP58639.1 hypothetical protein D7S86_01460 [Pararobbsia silviterrae]